MKIAILGAGNGGCAAAVDLMLKGFDVALCSALNPDHLRPVMDKGGLEYSGELGEGFVQIKATNSVKEAVDKADIIMIATPSTVHETYAQLIAPQLLSKQIVWLNGCTTGGALNVSRILREKGAVGATVCEMNSLAYAARLQNPVSVRIFHRMNYLLLSSFPAKRNESCREIVSEVYSGIEMAENVLETSLSNLNAILHPAGMVLNAGWVEFTKGNFYFYSQGITPAVARTIERVDEERLSILRKMNLRQITFVEHFHRHGMSPVAKGGVYESMQASDPDRYIRSPAILDDRYLLEDVAYGLVPTSSIAKQIGVQTPTIDALINLACILNEIDHWKKGLTAEKLGINDTDAVSLMHYLYEGSRT